MGFSGKNKKPIQGFFSSVWVFPMSRYKAGGLLVMKSRSGGMQSFEFDRLNSGIRGLYV
jgi:hypothetical protein